MMNEKKRTSNGNYLHIQFKEKCAVSSDITVSRRLVNLFTILHFVFAIDYGFVQCENVAICLCLRLFPLIQACCLSVAATYSMIFLETNSFSIVFDAMLMAKYVLSALVLFIHRKKMSFKEFQTELYKIDRNMGVSIRSDTKIILTIILIAMAILAHLFICATLYSDFYYFSYACYCLPLISDSIPTCVMYFVFYDVYLRLKHVEYKIINEKNMDIMFYQHIYKCLADLIDFLIETLNWMYTLVLLFGIPNMLITVYCVIFMSLKDLSIAIIIQIALYMVILSAYTYAPAFAAGMLSAQAEIIPVALHNKLLSELPDIDNHRKSDMEAFIMYTKIRPFKYSVMKVIPLGWSLPVVVLNIIITYTIVILQFSHIV